MWFKCFHVFVAVPPVHLKYNKILLTISVTFWTESNIIHGRIGQIPEHLSKDVDSESEDKIMYETFSKGTNHKNTQLKSRWK